MNALVSIVTAVYKTERYLHQCISSILNQTYPNWELILVDDGSPDSCPEICDQYAKQDSRIKVIHQQNRGAIHARNCGIREAAGEYIMFVDSDDWISPSLIQRIMDYAPFQMAIFGCTQTDDVGTVLDVSCPNTPKKDVRLLDVPNLIDEFCQNSLFGYACNKIYHQKYVKPFSFEAWKDREDLTFNLAVYQHITHLSIVDEPGYYYRQHTGSSLHCVYNCPVPNYIETASLIFQRFTDLRLRNSKLLANRATKTYLYDAIYRYIKNNDYLSQKEKKLEIVRLFSNKSLRSQLSIGFNECKMHWLLSVCFKLRLAGLYYQLGVK